MLYVAQSTGSPCVLLFQSRSQYRWVEVAAGLRLGASEQSDAVVMPFTPRSTALSQVLPILWRQQVVAHPI